MSFNRLMTVSALLILSFPALSAPPGSGVRGGGMGDRMMDRGGAMEQERAADRAEERAADRAMDRRSMQESEKDQKRKRIHQDEAFGAHMMSQSERQRLGERMRNAESMEERQQILLEHRRQMLQRAQERRSSIADPPYGEGIMSPEERARYQERLQNADSREEQNRIRDEQRRMMQERVHEHMAAPFGARLMTERERELHRERIRNAESEEERQRIRDEHREMMLKRAREWNIEIPQ